MPKLKPMYKVEMLDIQNRMEIRLQEKALLEVQLAQPNHPGVDRKVKERKGINYIYDGIHSFPLCQEGFREPPADFLKINK